MLPGGIHQVKAVVLAELDSAPCLVVLDNAETLTRLADRELANDLTELRDHSTGPDRNLRVIFTAAGVASPAGVAPNDTLSPPLLEPAAAATILALTSQVKVDSNDPSLPGVLRRCGGLPLALSLVGAVMRERGLRLQDVVAEWGEVRAQETGGVQAANSLSRALDLAIDGAGLSSAAAAVLALLTELPAGLDREVLGLLHFNGTDGALYSAKRLTDDLYARALVWRDDAGTSYALPPLLGHYCTATEHPARALLMTLIDVLGDGLDNRVSQAELRLEAIGAAFRIGADLRTLATAAFETATLSISSGTVLEPLRVAAAACGDNAALIDLELALGQLQVRSGDLRVAEAHVRRGLALAVSRELPAREASGRRSLGMIAMRTGDLGNARTLLTEALRLYQRSSDGYHDQRGAASCARDLGTIAFHEGRHADAQAALERACAKYREIGYRLGEANALVELGRVAAAVASTEEAAGLIERARQLHATVGSRLGEANALLALGRLAIEKGAAQRRDLLEGALNIFQRVCSRGGEANALLCLAVLDQEEGNATAARAKVEASRELAASIGDTDLVSRSDRLRSQLT